MMMPVGLGAIATSTVATDAQSASALAAAQQASGLPGMPPSLPVGVINSGGFSVLVVLNQPGSMYGYQLVPTPSSILLASLGLAGQTSFNNAQTVAILNAMQTADPSPSASACGFTLGASDTSACLGSAVSTNAAIAIGAGLLVLLAVSGGLR